MSNLSDSVEALKRAVAVPGTFADTFPDTSDDDLVALLMDALSEAQLDGFLSAFELDINTSEVTPDLSGSQGALVVIYGSYRMLINEIRNRQNRVKYEAGPTSFEQEQTASMLNEVLRQLNARKKDLLEQARLGALDTSGVYMGDLGYMKATSDYGWNTDLSLGEYRGL